jgi:hypothetical protein
MARPATKGRSAMSKSLSLPSLRLMSREAKVNVAYDMTSVLVKVTMNSVRKHHPGISKKKLYQLTRRRIHQRPPIWMDDMVPYFAEAGRPKLRDLAGKWKMRNGETEEILKGLKRFWSRWKYPKENRLCRNQRSITP